MGYEYFASPTAISRIVGRNEATRDLAYEVLPQFLQFPETQQSAAKALAYYRWPQSYEYLVEVQGSSEPLGFPGWPQSIEYKLAIRGSTEKAILFAMLGSTKAVPWIIQQYERFDRVFRSRPIFSYPQKMTYLNALYHLATPETLPFLDEVLKNPKPEKVKPRAEMVRDRILELFPQ